MIERDLIIHPGETIKEIILDRNMTQEELGIKINFSKEYISDVIKGKKSISDRFAKALENVFGISIEFWINLQNIYDKNIY